MTPETLALPTPATLPRLGAGDPALDHRELFARGVEEVRRTAHRTWTDHNVHDPGITTLELLAYTLTDLAYRASFPVQDLLASPTGNAQKMAERFPTARRLLTTRPFTVEDYRKVVIDLPGVKNAWVLPAPLTYYADTLNGRLLAALPADPRGVVPVEVRGLYRVLVELMDEVPPSRLPAILDDARRVLNANRGLCEDFVEFDAVETQRFVLCGEVELEPQAPVDETHAQILFRVQEYLSPPVGQYSLDEMRARTGPGGDPYTTEEIFDGPALRHGFIDDAELEEAGLRTELRLSDVISVVMDVPGVRTVRDMVISPSGGPPPASKWVIPVKPRHKPALERPASRLVFYKRGMPFVADSSVAESRYQDLAREAAARVEGTPVMDYPVPLGRFRDPGAYHSFQNHFPALYGLGEEGVVGVAPDERPRREVLAQQLKAYLLFFDQALAGGFAQLGRLGDLFSTDPEAGLTYFHPRVTSFSGHERIYAEGAGAVLEGGLDAPGVHVERRNRFLDHLIARYGESFHDFAEVMRTEFGAGPATTIAPKCAFLRAYPEMGAARPTAYDYTLRDDASLWNSDNVSGLERRLAHLLGIRGGRRNLSDVAYDIYAEVDDSPGDEFRFRVRHSETGKILLSSSTRYRTRDAARAEMRRAIRFASTPAGFQRKLASDGRWYFNVVDDTGEVIARRIESFETVEEMDAAIQGVMAHLRDRYGEEGMYLIESILLRPLEAGDPFLPICPDPGCTDCADEDPYSYRIHVILPAYAGRFTDMEFRRWAERVIREETPAHVQPKVCWIGRDDMATLESLYRDWLYLRAGHDATGRADRLRAFIQALFRVKNVYPPAVLHGCNAPEGTDKFILGRTAI